MSKYILNIKTGKIHDGLKNCPRCNNCNEANKKYFENYNDAVNFLKEKIKKEHLAECV